MSQPRISTFVVREDWQVENSLQLRNERHAASLTHGETGHLKNAEGLSGDFIGLILRDGPSMAHVRAQAFLPTFAPGVPLAIAFWGEEATRPLINVGVTVMIFESLEIDCGTAVTSFRPYMVRVDPGAFLQRCYRWTWGMFSLCIDEPKVWRGVAGLTPQDALPPVVAGQTFEFNTQGFMRYLAAAIEQKAPIEHVLPAYRDYLKQYPALAAAAEATFETLFCIAVLVHHRIGGRPITDVPALLHQDHLANVED